jgi:hypothetical protein
MVKRQMEPHCPLLKDYREREIDSAGGIEEGMNVCTVKLQPWNATADNIPLDTDRIHGGDLDPREEKGMILSSFFLYFIWCCSIRCHIESELREVSRRRRTIELSEFAMISRHPIGVELKTQLTLCLNYIY